MIITNDESHSDETLDGPGFKRPLSVPIYRGNVIGGPKMEHTTLLLMAANGEGDNALYP